jgi:hypothetical protein
MYLEHQGVLADQVVVPLDAHLDLYHALKRQAGELGDEISFKRTDLALFDLNAAARTVTCRLVEVKCYTAVGDIGAYQHLKDQIAAQIQQSEDVLSAHFDPHREPNDRADRLMKTRELSGLLEFYLDRSVRYGSITREAASEARYLLHTLENGYRLAFTRSALIFDFEKPGTEAPEFEGGIEFHRIGFDLIQDLVDSTSALEHAEHASELERHPAGDSSVSGLDPKADRTSSIPNLKVAAFLAETRDRSASWEDLRAMDLGSTGSRSDTVAPVSPMEENLR